MRIKDVMKKRNLSVYRMSAMSDIPYSTLMDIVNEKTQIEKCNVETIYKLCKALDKYKIDVLGLYVGILFMVIGIGFPAVKCREMQSLSETIQAFGFWILIPIMMTVVGVLQIVKSLKNRE